MRPIDGGWRLSFVFAIAVIGVFSPRFADADDDGPNLTGKYNIVMPSGHARPVSAVAFSGDGKRIATGSGDGATIVWEAAEGRQIESLFDDRNHAISRLAFSPDGALLATGSEDGTIAIWDVEKGTKLKTLSWHSGRITALVFSRGRKRLISASADRSAILWEIDSSRKLQEFNTASGIASAVVDPDDKRLVTNEQNGSVIVWELAAGRRIQKLVGPKAAQPAPEAGDDELLKKERLLPMATAFSADGKRLAASLRDTTLVVWNAETFEVVHRFEKNSEVANLLMFTPDGKQLLATLYGSKQYDPNAPNAADAFRHALVAWDLAAAKQIRDVPIFCVPWAISPTAGQIAASNETYRPGDPQGAWLFDAATGKKAGQLQPQLAAGPAAISGNGRQMAIVVPYEIEQAHTVLVYQFGRDATTSRRLTIPAVRALQFSTDGKWLAGSFNNELGRWDLAAGGEKPVSSIQMFTNDSDPHFSDDTSRVLDAGYYKPQTEAGANTIWRIGLVDGRAQRFATMGHNSETAMSGDGRLVAVGDASVTLYDMQDDKPTRVIYKARISRNQRSPLLFSPDGKLLAVATYMAEADEHANDSNAAARSRGNHQRRVLLFDTQSGRKVQDFPSHDRWEGEALAFSHDGRKLALNSEQGFVVWSTDTGKKIWEGPIAPSDYLFKVWFSDNGKLLAGVDKHAVRYYDAASGEPCMTLLFLDAGREWFAVTPDGSFDGSERGRNIISVQTGSGPKAVPIQDAQPDRYRPGLVDRILAGERLAQSNK